MKDRGLTPQPQGDDQMAKCLFSLDDSEQLNHPRNASAILSSAPSIFLFEDGGLFSLLRQQQGDSDVPEWHSDHCVHGMVKKFWKLNPVPAPYWGGALLWSKRWRKTVEASLVSVASGRASSPDSQSLQNKVLLMAGVTGWRFWKTVFSCDSAPSLSVATPTTLQMWNTKPKRHRMWIALKLK